MTLSRLVALASFAILVTAAVLATQPADAVQDGPVRMEVLVNGRSLPEYRSRNTTYIEAQKNAEYTIRLTNTQGIRVAVALAVDGRNSIDAKRTSAANASKWVLDPYESIVVSGWQTSHSAAHKFLFTTEQSSYAAWLGDTSNLGVIEAVVFREKARQVTEILPPKPDYSPREEERKGWGWGWWGGRSDKGSDDAPSADMDGEREAAAAPQASGSESRPAGKSSGSNKGRDLRPAPNEADGYAATGFGREMSHQVQEVAMELESSPAGSVRLRYEYRQALIDLGVLPNREPLARREGAGGFDDSRFSPIP